MQFRVAGQDGAVERPFAGGLHEFGARRVGEDVMAHGGEGVAATFLLFQNVIVRLMLKPLRGQQRFEMRTQERHAVALVGVRAQPHPDQMQMIRHEAIRRAEQTLARGGVQHEFAKRGVKRFAQPAASSVRDGKRPVNHCVTLIILARQARKIKRAVEVWYIHGDRATVADVRRLKLKTGFEVSLVALAAAEREEALNSLDENRMSLLTSAATGSGLRPPPAPAPAFRKGVNVLLARTEEIQKVHAHVFAGLADAQKNQIFPNAFLSG